MRRAISMTSWSLKAAGAERSELSMEIATSALLRAGREVEPEKITSSIVEARMDLCEDSPITQRSASTRFDLPQPFGPTTPVSPGSIRKSVGSTNDLKPIRRSRVSFILHASSTKRDERPLARWVLQWTVEQSGQGLGPGQGSFAAWAGRMNLHAPLSNPVAQASPCFPDLSASRRSELWRRGLPRQPGRRQKTLISPC